MNKTATTHCSPTPDEIAAGAYQNYEREGRPEGRDLDHWLAAEAQLLAERAQPVRPAAATARSVSVARPKAAASAAPVAGRISRAEARASVPLAR
jgi:hypothetical protein